MSRMNSFNLNNLNAGVRVVNQLPNHVQPQTENSNRTNFLNQFIGRKCTCEFYLDADIIKKTGLLDSVGADFFVLISTSNPEERLICPLDELKFINYLKFFDLITNIFSLTYHTTK